MPHSNYKQIRAKRSLKPQPLQLLPTTPCVVIGQGRVVVIVVVVVVDINAPYPSLFLKK